MPQATSQIQTNGGQDYQADSKDPIAFIYQHRKRLNNMDPDKAVRFVDRMFKRYALPKYQRVNQQRPLDEEELGRLRLQFAARMFNLKYDPKTELKDPKVERGALEKAGQFVSATGSGVIGGIKTIAELKDKLEKHLPIVGGYIHKQNVESIKRMGEAEGKAYGEAKEVTPIGASVGAGIGHLIPATIASGGVESMMPAVGAEASIGAKALASGAKQAAGWGTFGATTPGGHPARDAMWGGVLGAAFPLLGKMFGLGRKAVSPAPEAAKAVGTATAEGAAAKAAPAETMGGIADKAAKKKFGKAFKDLTSAEKAQMPEAMKEEIKAQQAVKQANKKAEVAAAKAGREAEKTAQRAVKAEAATAKAAQQAAKRAVVPAATPVAKQAVAAQAASENPSIAKTLGGVEKSAGPLSEIKGPDPIRDARIKDLENLAKTGSDTEKAYAESALKDMKEHPFESGDTLGEDIRKARAKEGSKPITKLSPEETGPKVRAKEGKPASPAQQAADRERIAKKRELSKSEEFGSALEKHAQEMAGRHTAGSIGMMHIPELEDTMKEFPNGELFLKGFQKLRKAGRITDEIYTHEMIEWLKTQFEAAP